MNETKDAVLFETGPPAPNIERYPLAEKYGDRYGSSLVKEGIPELMERFKGNSFEVIGDEHKDAPILNYKSVAEVQEEIGYEGQITEMPLSDPGNILRNHHRQRRIKDLMIAAKDRILANCDLVILSKNLQLTQVQEEAPFVLITKGLKVHTANSFWKLTWSVFKSWVRR